MAPQFRIVFTALLLTLPAISVAHFALADPPTAQTNDAISEAEKKPALRRVPALPSQAAFAHHLRLRVVNVTPIEQIDRTQILKLEVERHYGKIDTVSLKRAKDHETSRLTILFPASLGADVRPDDLIDYGLVGYTAVGRR